MLPGQNNLRPAIVKEAAKIAIVLQKPLFLPFSKLAQILLNQPTYGAIWQIIHQTFSAFLFYGYFGCITYPDYVGRFGLAGHQCQ